MALAVASFTYFLPSPTPLPTRIDDSVATPSGKRGLLLVNLGSPAAPTRSAVRAFLKQFLGDPRVVEANRAVWAFVLNVIILPFRSGKSAKLYQSIWTDAGSPLITNGVDLCKAVAQHVGARYEVVLGMRYGEPSIASAFKELRGRGCSSVLVLPLFPHRTAWLLAERLGLARDEWEMVFQSQFGSEPWLQPYLDEYVPDLAMKYKRVRVMAPSFAADCLETIEEIGTELRKDFAEAGGEELIVVPALNSDPSWVRAIDDLVRNADKEVQANRPDAAAS
ncbi:UNVERIFIED_CONTAM: hypothetical protein GTU68_047532 [Idotea baltica]|nr:hypothetical protein [Idotea baltica]